MTEVLVSVCVITYNHCDYIRQCFDGILMQQTNFPFEIIVNDDCSTDGTAEIIKEYELKHPALFKVTYQKENQYSKGVRGMFPKFCFPRAKGKYIASCEGDDYWIDPLKLQKQVDFLESNLDYVLVCHQYRIMDGCVGQSSCEWLQNITHFNFDFYIVSNTWVIQPLTVLFRTCSFNFEEYSLYRNSKDVTLFYYLLKSGDGFLMQDEMGVYRLHDGGTFSNLSWVDKIIGNLTTISSINDVECDKSSAIMLKCYFDKNIPYLGRKTMFKKRRLFYTIFCKLWTYFGFMCVCRRLIYMIFKVDNKILR